MLIVVLMAAGLLWSAKYLDKAVEGLLTPRAKSVVQPAHHKKGSRRYA